HHEQPIAGEKEVVTAQRRHQPTGDLKGQALRAPDKTRAILEYEGKPERQQQTVEWIAPIKAANQHTLDDDAEERGEKRRKQKTAPEPDIGDQRESDVAADRQKSAVREIDHA